MHLTSEEQREWTSSRARLPELDKGSAKPDRTPALADDDACTETQSPAVEQNAVMELLGTPTMAQFLENLPQPRLFHGRMSFAIFLADIAALIFTCAVDAILVSSVCPLTLHQVWTFSLSLSVPILIGNLLAGLYPGIALNPVVEFRQLSRNALISFVGVALIARVGALGNACYLFLAIAVPMQFLMAPLARCAIRATCCGRKWWGFPVMIFGAGEAAQTVVLNLLQHPSYGLRPAVVVDAAAKAEQFSGIAVVNQPRVTSVIAKRMGIRHAILVLPDLSQSDVTRLLDRYANGIRHVFLTSAISPFLPGLAILWRDTRDLAGIAGVEVRNRLLDPTPRLIKGTMDLTLTIGGLICISPLLLALALLVKLTSKGPIFYGHTRVGHNGKRFQAWKFRSMVTNGQEVFDAYLANNPAAREEWDRDHKLKNDPRVTRIGAFLRKTSLDELPQLWNVVRGEMSLVGPRPIVHAEIAKYGKAYRVYKAVRPGITGLWQVSGRNNTTYDERLYFDEYYVKNWSPWLDMHVLARTFSTLLLGRGAY